MHSAYRHIPWNLKTGSLEDFCMFIFFITLCIIINLRMLILLWRNHVYKNDIYNRNFVWYIQFRHTLLVKDKTITETALLLTVTISKLESDGFHSSNLAIALLIGICMYIFYVRCVAFSPWHQYSPQQSAEWLWKRGHVIRLCPEYKYI